MTTKTVDPSYVRLKAALAAVRPDKPTGSTAIGKLFGEVPQTVGNWQTRGVPIERAVDAQRRWGINAVWVLYNEGDMLVGGPSQSGRLSDATLDQALEILYYVSMARPDDSRFSRLTWASIQAAAKAVERGGGDQRKIVSDILEQIEHGN